MGLNEGEPLSLDPSPVRPAPTPSTPAVATPAPNAEAMLVESRVVGVRPKEGLGFCSNILSVQSVLSCWLILSVLFC